MENKIYEKIQKVAEEKGITNDDSLRRWIINNIDAGISEEEIIKRLEK